MKINIYMFLIIVIICSLWEFRKDSLTQKTKVLFAIISGLTGTVLLLTIMKEYSVIMIIGLCFFTPIYLFHDNLFKRGEDLDSFSKLLRKHWFDICWYFGVICIWLRVFKIID